MDRMSITGLSMERDGPSYKRHRLGAALPDLQGDSP